MSKTIELTTKPVAVTIAQVDEMIAELSRLFKLQPGDIIMTGTPAGVFLQKFHYSSSHKESSPIMKSSCVQRSKNQALDSQSHSCYHLHHEATFLQE